jgi:Flp pilus assembly protein TadG
MNNLTRNPHLGLGLWPAVFADPRMWQLVILGLFCLVIAVLCVVAILRLHTPLWRQDGRSEEEVNRGAATIEFVMVFPILLFMTLLLAQTAQIMVGNIYVHYAAFAATRSAIVQLPMNDIAEPSSVLWQAQNSAKYAAIRNAAVFALVPVSGTLSDGDVPGGDFREALENLYTDYARTPPNWVSRLAAGRLRYASNNTDIYVTVTWVDEDGNVNFRDLADGETYRYGPKDPITVRIEHRLHLSVPYVKAIFDDGGAEAGDGVTSSTFLRAHYTLTNQGIADQLPVVPELPRFP